MLQVARLAPTLLNDSTPLVRDFVLGRLNGDGGFQDRAGGSDLYYTVFGLEALLALREEPPRATRGFLEAFGDGASLDFVHLACLARCWAAVGPPAPDDRLRGALLARVESYRSADGGYAPAHGAEQGTAYACFLALGASQDLRASLPNAAAILSCLDRLRTEDGGFANAPDLPLGSTLATAAAITLLRHLHREPPAALGRWLLARCRPEGGFLAGPAAPLPDLLSTATALHALAAMHVPLGGIKEACLDFLDTLWTNRGAFHGHWADADVDCEYTWYGLLALGHLSLA
jgi:prenyltransferase beta subunit